MIALLLSWPAQAYMCAERETVLKGLSKYKEAPVSMGLTSNGMVLEILAAREGETWTIIFTRPDGVSCVVATGEYWRFLEPKKGEPS